MFINGTTIEWGPEGGVLRIVMRQGGQSLTLSGYCRYWMTDMQMGGFACPEHPEVGLVSYWWTGERFVRESRMPVGGPILEGEWLPDGVWHG